MMRTCLISIIGFMVISGHANAAEPQWEVHPKSRSAALAYSLSITVVSGAVGCFLLQDSKLRGSEIEVAAAVVYPGLTFGPGAGHLYAGKKGRFWRGALLRGIVLPLAAYGAAASSFSSSFSLTNRQGFRQENKWGLCLIASGIYLISAMNDILDLGESVDDYNYSHGLADFRLRPCLYACRGEVGLILVGRF